MTKLIYLVIASYAFVQIIHLHYNRREVTHRGHIEEGNFKSTLDLETGIKAILGILWANENKYFLLSMAILVHLFSLALYQDYSILVNSVPLLTLRSLIAVLYAIVSNLKN